LHKTSPYTPQIFSLYKFTQFLKQKDHKNATPTINPTNLNTIRNKNSIMKVNNYFYAGLDFMFDKKGDPWFIEANFSPRSNTFYSILNNHSVMDGIAKLMKKNGGNIAVMGSDVRRGKNTGVWHYHVLKKKIPNVRLCYSRQNKKNRSRLIDSKGDTFKPSTIFRHYYNINPAIERKALTINPTIIKNTVGDKSKCLEIINEAKVKHPLTVIVKNKEDVRKIIAQNPETFKEGFVMKPNDSTEGIGVHVLRRGEKIPEINKEELLEQRIVPRLHHHSFWDVRTYVINGKFCGGLIRESKKRITNTAMGAHALKVPQNILRKLKKPSMRAVKAIDRRATEEIENI